MDEATLAQTILSASLFAIFLGFLVWGIRSGQFKNVEEAKYTMFPDEKTLSDNIEAGAKDGEKKK